MQHNFRAAEYGAGAMTVSTPHIGTDHCSRMVDHVRIAAARKVKPKSKAAATNVTQLQVRRTTVPDYRLIMFASHLTAHYLAVARCRKVRLAPLQSVPHFQLLYLTQLQVRRTTVPDYRLIMFASHLTAHYLAVARCRKVRLAPLQSVPHFQIRTTVP